MLICSVTSKVLLLQILGFKCFLCFQLLDFLVPKKTQLCQDDLQQFLLVLTKRFTLLTKKVKNQNPYVATICTQFGGRNSICKNKRQLVAISSSDFE